MRKYLEEVKAVLGKAKAREDLAKYLRNNEYTCLRDIAKRLKSCKCLEDMFPVLEELERETMGLRRALEKLRADIPQVPKSRKPRKKNI